MNQLTYKDLINPIIFLQVRYIRMIMQHYNITTKEFLELNKQKNIIGFLRDNYESFHLTGEDGVMEELCSFVQKKSLIIN